MRQTERNGAKAASVQPPLPSAMIRLRNVIWEFREERAGWLDE